jgi:hypothetical protein
MSSEKKEKDFFRKSFKAVLAAKNAKGHEEKKFTAKSAEDAEFFYPFTPLPLYPSCTPLPQIIYGGFLSGP